MLCGIRTSKPSIQIISIIMWFLKHSLKYIHHHNHKQNSRQSTCKSYKTMISSTINLSQMKTAVTITSKHYLLAKIASSNLHLKHNFQIGRYILFLFEWAFHFNSFGCLVSPFLVMKMTMYFKGHHADKKSMK